jgi:hypothetical protein
MSVASAQDILHYKFDGACGSTVINYAAGTPAPAIGTVVTSPPGGPFWTAGRFGLALAPSGVGPTAITLDTGFAPHAMTGSLSWACWLRVHPGSNQLGAPIGLFGDSSGGWMEIAGTFLTTGSFVTSFQGTNLFPLVQSGWTHVAVVLDSSTLTGTYYLNGTPQPPVPFAGAMNWTATSMQIGQWGLSSFVNRTFDIDEFILANRAMSAAEIAVLATDPRGADAPFGLSAGARFTGNGQRPVPGNQSYGLVLNSNAGAAWLVFGQSRCTMAGGTISLPVDLGTLNPRLNGLSGEVDTDLGVLTVLAAGGPTSIPFPLPNLPGLSGFQCYGQALVLDAASLQFTNSNALAIGIGR